MAPRSSGPECGVHTWPSQCSIAAPFPSLPLTERSAPTIQTSFAAAPQTARQSEALRGHAVGRGPCGAVPVQDHGVVADRPGVALVRGPHAVEGAVHAAGEGCPRRHVEVDDDAVLADRPDVGRARAPDRVQRIALRMGRAPAPAVLRAALDRGEGERAGGAASAAAAAPGAAATAPGGRAAASRRSRRLAPATAPATPSAPAAAAIPPCPLAPGATVVIPPAPCVTLPEAPACAPLPAVPVGCVDSPVRSEPHAQSHEKTNAHDTILFAR